MIPLLTYPLALMALGSLPALAAIYILRNRFRRRQVSSLVLWRFHAQSRTGGSKVHHLQLPFLFFLELLTLLLLVVAASGPHWTLPQSARPLIVVLDDSFSMRAIHGGVSARARAQSFLERLFRQPPPSTRLILANVSPRALGGIARTRREVEALLVQWRCWSPDAAIDAAISLAAELGKQQANILVLTDHPPAEQKISNPRVDGLPDGSLYDQISLPVTGSTAATREYGVVMYIKPLITSGVQLLGRNPEPNMPRRPPPPATGVSPTAPPGSRPSIVAGPPPPPAKPAGRM